MKKIKIEALLFPIFDILLNGFNFGIVIYISWKLDIKDFGRFNALLSFLAILFIVGISIQTYTAKKVSQVNNTNIINNTKGIMITGVLINGLYIIMIPVLETYFKSSLLSLIIINLMFNVHIVLSYNRGRLQGKKLFKQLNISFYIEVLTRVILTIILLSIWNKIELTLTAILVGMIASLIHGHFIIISINDKQHNKENNNSIDQKKFKQLVNIAIGNGCMYYITSIGIIIVNNRSSQGAGVFSLSSKFSQLIVAIILSIVTVLIPYASKKNKEVKIFKKFVGQWLGILSLIAVVIWIGYIVFLPILAKLILNEEYRSISTLVNRQSLTYIFIGLSQFIIAMEVIRERSLYIVILVLYTIIYTMILSNITMTLGNIITAEIIMNLLLLLILGYLFFKRSESNEKLTIPIMERY